MDLNKKLEELKPYQLNCNVFDVYSYNGLTMQDLLCQFFTKINECITVSNETIDLAKWLVNEGLEIEVVKKLMIWLEDGTLENIINVNLFNTLNEKINGLSSQLEHNQNELTKKANVTTNDYTIYVNPQGNDNNDGLTVNTAFQTFKKAIDSIPDIVNHHVKIKVGDGVYNQTYDLINGASIENYPTGANKVIIGITNKKINEGASILIEGNINKPGNVILDGDNIADSGIYVLNTNRVNVRGVKITNCKGFTVNYKRYSTGQLKDVIIDGGQYGLFSYQYSFVELQGNVQINNATMYGIMAMTFGFVNIVGLTMNDNAGGLKVDEHGHITLGGTTQNIFNNKGSSFAIERDGFIFAQNLKTNEKIGTINLGSLVLSQCDITFKSFDHMLAVYNSTVRISNTKIKSGLTDVSTITGLGIWTKRLGNIEIVDSVIEGFYQNISVSGGGNVYIENTDISNARYDGVNINGGTSYLKNVRSSTSNGRYGVRFVSGNYFDGGSNTIIGNQENQLPI